MTHGERVATPLGRFLRYWLPVLLYVTAIFTLSAQPGVQPPLRFQNADKVAHVVEYLILGLLLARALRSPGRSPLAWSLTAVGLGVLIAGGDEVFQSFVPGRDASVFDFLADVTGLLFAQIVHLIVGRD